MELHYTEEQQAFRQEVREFIAAKLPPDIRARINGHKHLKSDDVRTWQRILFEQGWGAPGWPKAAGGAGWDPIRRHIFEEEYVNAGAPRQLDFGIAMVGPVIIAFGTPAQQQYFLPKILNGEHWWCQGYSEPGAGSDLASLKTRAERRGDHYVVNGQKTWNTLGQYADWIFCLVRTSSEARPAGGHLVPADRHEDAGHHGAPDHDARRRARDQRHLLRRRQGAGREPRRRREQGLDLRQVPARPRARRHRQRAAREEDAGAAEGDRARGAARTAGR